MPAKKTIIMGVIVVALVAAGWLLRGFIGGSGAQGGPAMGHGPGAAPQVTTAMIMETAVVPPDKYVGHVEAIQDAEIFAQVEGTIQAVNFKEGAIVKQGDLLYTIDPRRYQAKVDLYEATLAQAQASLLAAKANLESVNAQLAYSNQYLERLKKAGARSVVQADVDKAQSDARRYKAASQQAQAQIRELEAQIKQSEANLEVARIDLAYTQVRAPITGRIGRAEVTVGDYVSPGNVMMARIVQMDPVRVRFAISDRKFLDLYKTVQRRGIEAIKARLVLANGDAYNAPGGFDFLGNRISLETGTIELRLRYENGGGELVPGGYVQVLVENPGTEHRAVVPQESVMTDESGEYVYVVSPDGVAAKRPVKLGDTLGTGRIVLSGLKAGETVVVQGLQKVRPGQPVKVAAAEPPKEGPNS